MKKIFISLNKKNLSLIVTLIFLSGCGIWTDFTTYFNAYFNASQAFDEGLELMMAGQREIFLYKEPPLLSTAKTKFDAVIDKCSKILQFASESSYFDDALFMLGKAFYYEQDFQKAIRKFKELEVISESDLLLQNKLWIGKTEVQLRNYDAGMKILDETKQQALNEGEIEIAEEVYKFQIGFLIFQEQYINAIDLCRNLIDICESDELKARAALQIGKMYKLLEDYENADIAFSEVKNYSPDFLTEFESLFESATIKKDLGKIDESLALLEDIRNEDKFSDGWDRVDLEIGKIYYDRKQYENAMDKFIYVDTSYVQNPSSGIASFYRAMIWENYYRDFDSAIVFYDRAAGAKTDQEYKDSAKRKSSQISKYFEIQGTLFDLEKQLLYAVNPEAFIQDSLDYEAFKDRDSTLNANKTKDNQNNEEMSNRNEQGTVLQQQFKNQSDEEEGDDEAGEESDSTEQKIRKFTKQPVRPALTADSLKQIVAKTTLALGNHFFTELVFPDSAYFYYNKIVTELDSTSSAAKAYYSIGTYYLSMDDTLKADSIFSIVYHKFRTNPISIDAARQLGIIIDIEKDPAKEIYLKAEDLLVNKDYESALKEFFSIYQDYPRSLFAPKALYSAGWLLENELGMLDSAALVYDTLSTKFASSTFAKVARPKVQIWKEEMKRRYMMEDSLRKAKEDSLAKINGIPDSLSTTIKDRGSIIVNDDRSEPAAPDSTANINNMNNALPDSTSQQKSSLDVKIDGSTLKKMTPEQRRRYLDSLKNLQNQSPPGKDSTLIKDLTEPQKK